MSDYAAGSAPVIRSGTPEPTYHGQKDRSANTAVKVMIRGMAQEIMLRLPPERVREALQNPSIIKAALDQKFYEFRNFVDTVYDGLEPHEKAALKTSPVPILGDAVGIYSDALNYIQDPESRTLANGLLTAASALPLVPTASQIRAANKVRKNLQVWHGSPHKFDRFSMDMIGTGEGAQAYGHGLYFAESEDVAKSYAPRNIDNENVLLDMYNKAVDSQDYDAATIYESAMLHQSPAQLRTRFLNDEYAEYSQDSLDKMAKAIDAVEAMPGSNMGGLYRASINADPDTLLDWDTPLSEQPNVLNSLVGYVEAATKDKGGNVLLADGYTQHIAEALKYPEDVKGWDLYSTLADAAQKGDTKLNQIEATQRLRDAGIPGIRYLDGMSRGVGEGSRNYVIFDDSLIDILERDGKQIQGVLGNSGVID